MMPNDAKMMPNDAKMMPASPRKLVGGSIFERARLGPRATDAPPWDLGIYWGTLLISPLI